jgi:uncharacterized membrane protein YeaQ/YmgE (transglycosylase-associated protein family)
LRAQREFNDVTIIWTILIGFVAGLIARLVTPGGAIVGAVIVLMIWSFFQSSQERNRTGV